MESSIRINIMLPGKIFFLYQFMPMTKKDQKQHLLIRVVAAGLTGRQTGNEFKF